MFLLDTQFRTMKNGFFRNKLVIELPLQFRNFMPGRAAITIQIYLSFGEIENTVPKIEMNSLQYLLPYFYINLQTIFHIYLIIQVFNWTKCVVSSTYYLFANFNQIRSFSSHVHQIMFLVFVLCFSDHTDPKY